LGFELHGSLIVGSDSHGDGKEADEEDGCVFHFWDSSTKVINFKIFNGFGFFAIF